MSGPKEAMDRKILPKTVPLRDIRRYNRPMASLQHFITSLYVIESELFLGFVWAERHDFQMQFYVWHVISTVKYLILFNSANKQLIN
jgi:hypothetical protein